MKSPQPRLRQLGWINTFVILSGVISSLTLVGCGGASGFPEDVEIGHHALGCGELAAGGILKAGQSLESCEGKSVLIMQNDGNLVAYYKPTMFPYWHTNTFKGDGSWAVMQGDGNFVVYDRNNRPVWATGTENKGGNFIAIQDDGNLVVYSPSQPVWASSKFLFPTSVRCGLRPGEQMKRGQSLKSCNGEFHLEMQGDGNLVVYDKEGKPTWASNTNGSDASKKGLVAVMQNDGNFVIYSETQQPLLASITAGQNLAALAFNDDGTLSVVKYDNQVAWSTGGGSGSVGSVPGSLVSSLSARPYVEQSCQDTSYPGWPFEAKRCTYSAGGISASVVIANPSPERTARWIVDSARMIPELDRLKNSDPANYEEGLKAIGRAMMIQSSRIFPLSGGIIENMGSGYTTYSFENGVTRSCSTGCYCRLNSLHRREWCDYQAAMGAQDRNACMAAMGSSGYTNGWGGECMDNHKRAWNSDVNDHFRAKAFTANYTVASRCPSGQCSGSAVVAAVRAGFGL